MIIYSYQSFLLLLITTLTIRTKANLHIGCLFENERSYLNDVIKQSEMDHQQILQDFRLRANFTFKHGQCNASQALGKAAELLLLDNVDALIGPNCNDACPGVSQLSAFSHVPMISYGCSAKGLSTKNHYLQTSPHLLHDLRNIARIYINFIYDICEWTKLSIVYSDKQPWGNLTQYMEEEMKSKSKKKKKGKKKNIVNKYLIQRYNLKELTEIVREDARIVMFACEPENVTNYFRHFTKENDDMLKKSNKYAFLTIDYDMTKIKEMSDFLKRIKNNIHNKKDVNDGFGYINIAVKVNTTLKAVSPKITKYLTIKQRNDTQKVYEAGYVYDSMHAYLLAVNKTIYTLFKQHILNTIRQDIPDISASNISQWLKEHGLTYKKLMDHKTKHTHQLDTRNWTFPITWYTNYSNMSLAPVNVTHVVEQFIIPEKFHRRNVMESFQTLRYEGVTGDIQFTATGARYPIVEFNNIVYSKNARVPTTSTLYEYNSAAGKIQENDVKSKINNVIWADGSNEKPKPNFPPEDLLLRQVILGVIIPIISFAIIAVGYRVYQNQKYEGDLLNKNILFKFAELDVPQIKVSAVVETTVNMEGSAEKPPLSFSPDVDEQASMIQTESESTSDVNTPKKAPITKKKKGGAVNLLDGLGNVNIATGIRTFFAKFRLDDVFVKQIPKPQVLVTREILVELKEIRDLRHPNLNPYDGVCVGPPYVLLVSPICKKGTLLDILQTEDIQLNWVFRYTFATDIANGLAALHESPLKYHGHLTSRNVLVDSRWNCKITDYGLSKFKQVLPLRQPSNDPVLEGKIYEALLWTAPENIQYPYPKKSKEGDIYSFGIILAEIINRSQGFASFKNYTSRDIVHFIQKRCIPPFRPHVRLQSGLDGRALDLMRSCWDEFPENRPTIGELRAKLKTIHNTKTNSKNLLDDMIDMMEKYAHDLEVALNERTGQLTVEKEKSERANFLSLPEPVAEFLEGGNMLTPQISSSATVMLIKIDDITSFYNTLTPHQIVDLLDDVHRLIEKVCDKHVVEFIYDRERHAIGCSLLVPVRSHSSRVAKAALKIMSSLTTFSFRHIKRHELRLCIAIHSGEFMVALQEGRVPTFIVLGNNMKYIEMVLDGTPKNRIFITNDALKNIKQDFGPDVEPSGHILVKGIGPIQGHFLVGMKGLNVKLPKVPAKEIANKPV